MSTSPRAIMPRHDIAATGSNLLLLLAICFMIMWFFRLCRTFYRLYRLSKAIATDQVMRLQTSDLQADERSMLFGEMEMLWRTNHQQQLLRARHKPSAMDVSELKVPFFIDKNSIEVHEVPQTDRVGLNFRFRMTQRMAIQVFWQVKASALRELLARINKEHLGIGGNVATAGRKKKRFFGQGYMSVNRDGANLEPDSAAGRSFEMSDRQSLGDSASPLRAAAPIFAEAQCAAASKAVKFNDDGHEPWVLYNNPEECQVPLQAHRAFLPPSPPPAPAQPAADEAPSDELRTPAQLDDEEAAGEVGSASRGRSRVEPDVVVEDIDEVSTEAAAPAPDVGGAEEGGEDRYPVVIVAKTVQEDGGMGVWAREGGEGSGKESAQERVKFVLIVTKLDGRAGGEGRRKLQVDQQVVVSSRAAYVSKEIYGEEEDDAQEECVICFSEPKDTTLLPCRHLCVCSSCFARLDECPICRDKFTAYLRVPVKQQSEGEAQQTACSDPAEEETVQGQS